MGGYRYTVAEVDSIPNVTIAACKIKCDEYFDPNMGRGCLSFEYNPSSKQCILSSKRESDFTFEEDRTQDFNWLHYDYRMFFFVII